MDPPETMHVRNVTKRLSRVGRIEGSSRNVELVGSWGVATFGMCQPNPAKEQTLAQQGEQIERVVTHFALAGLHIT